MRNIEEVLKLALPYDMRDVMVRYAEKTRLESEVLAEHEREIKRYLAMCAVTEGGYGMRGPIDELWHTFIIFTASYTKFCNLIAGRYIHHVPTTPPLEVVENPILGHEPPRSAGRSYQNFLEDYEVVFREIPPAHLWPRLPVGLSIDGSGSCNVCRCHWCQRCMAIINEGELVIAPTVPALAGEYTEFGP